MPEDEMKMWGRFLEPGVCASVCALVADAFVATTTFLLGSAKADAQNASAINATLHRPIQPARRGSPNRVFIPELCAFFGRNTTSKTANFLAIIAKGNVPAAVGSAGHWLLHCAVRSPPPAFRKLPPPPPTFVVPPANARR